MFAACILFMLPTIKDEMVKSDTHPVYNTRVYGIGGRSDRIRDYLRYDSIPQDKERYFELLQKKANLELKYLQEENLLEVSTTLLRNESAKGTPDVAEIKRLQTQIVNLRDSLQQLRKVLAELRKEIDQLMR